MTLLRNIDLQELRDPTKKNIVLTGRLFDSDMDIVIGELTTHPRKVNLDLSRNNFSPRVITRLANSGIEFESLDLSRCNVDKNCFMALVSAKNIKRLSVYYSGCCIVNNAGANNDTIYQPRQIELCDHVSANAQQVELNVEGTLLDDKWLPENYKGKIAARIAQNREYFLPEPLNCHPAPVRPSFKMSKPLLKRHFENGNGGMMDAVFHDPPAKRPKNC